MNRAIRQCLGALILACLLAACGKSGGPGAGASAAVSDAKAHPAGPEADSAASAETTEQRRFLAVRHALLIQTGAAGAEAAWRQAEAACAAAGCDVLTSTLEHEDPERPARATLEARVPPAKVEAFLKQAGGLGTVRQHSKTAEDKTDEVLDTEARLKNMTAFRDKLRQLLLTPNAKLQELIEVEREMVKVQSDLDSLASRRKALSNLTDKVFVSLTFSEVSSASGTSAWYPVRSALSDAGHMLASSVGRLITTVVALLPWAAVLLGLGAGGRALWRRRRRPA